MLCGSAHAALHPLVLLPLGCCRVQERYKMIQKWVIEPRKVEEAAIAKGEWTCQYQYHKASAISHSVNP
jgi:hypothetical protein